MSTTLKFTEQQLLFLAGRLQRIARKPYTDDHRCQCSHPVTSHSQSSGRCFHAGCACKHVTAGIDSGCDCSVCIAKDAFEQAESMAI